MNYTLCPAFDMYDPRPCPLSRADCEEQHFYTDPREEDWHMHREPDHA